MGYFIADEEICFLGYYLTGDLWRMPGFTGGSIDNSFGQLIDRNYIPLKLGIGVSDEGDSIKSKWKNEDFDRLCNQLKILQQAKVTDILFGLFDLSSEAREHLIKTIKITKNKTLTDRTIHSYSTLLNNDSSPRIGFSHVSLNSDNIGELREKLLTLCMLRKYKEKADVWIGFGTLPSSSMIIDAVVFNNQNWKYDEFLEEESKPLVGRFERIGRKVGRNEKCPCGSMRKYKHCCGN